MKIISKLSQQGERMMQRGAKNYVDTTKVVARDISKPLITRSGDVSNAKRVVKPLGKHIAGSIELFSGSMLHTIANCFKKKH